jgi:ketosteroid isomerase-like protein
MRCITLLAAAAVVLIPTASQAQEWSATQQEVWQNVETFWDLGAQEDIEGSMGYFHDDFLGWFAGQWVPTNKADRRVTAERNYETTDAVWHYLKPLGIKVHGNVAIAHYIYSVAYLDSEGTEQSSWGHCTDILMKQGDKWVFIGDACRNVSN